MAVDSSPTTFADVHPHIIQTHILPRLDGPSLSSAATASSYLQNVCSDDNLWSHICKSTWPSVTDPRLDHLISTFPAGHRSFFQDSFPALITQDNRRRSLSNRLPDCPTGLPVCPSELISAVDIHYRNDILYSTVKFTDTTTGFLSPALTIELNNDQGSNRPASGISLPTDMKVDELSGADDATISHLKESVTLNWILIDPTKKRAGNLSSIKPVAAKKHWMTNEIHLLYVTVLPGCDPNEMVQCRIKVTCAVGKGGVGLHVRQVNLHIQDLDYRVINGKDFLVITERAISEENNVKRRKVVVGEEGERRYREFKEMRKEKIRVGKKGKTKKEGVC